MAIQLMKLEYGLKNDKKDMRKQFIKGTAYDLYVALIKKD